MSFEDKKKIAMFISVSHNHYQKALITHFSNIFNDNGYYFFVYSFNGAYGTNPAYVEGERVLAQLPSYEDYDGIILCQDTFGDLDAVEDIYTRIKAKAKCPVVAVRRECGTYNSVLVDEGESMTALMKHLLDDHNYRDFFFVSGPEDHPDAQKRFKCYSKVLNEYGIKVSEKDYVYSNFWNTRGKQDIDELFLKRDGKLPEVIVCANDYMAIAICNELSARNIRVPEDVCVTGFDDIDDAALSDPPLTSVKVSVSEMARATATMLLDMIEGKPVRRREYIKTKAVKRVSCGCMQRDYDVSFESMHSFYEKAEKAKHENLQTVFMNIETESAITIKELNVICEKYVYNNIGCKDFFIVYNDFLKHNETNNNILKGFESTMKLGTYIKDLKCQDSIDISLTPRELLPEEVICAEPSTYHISVIHYLDRIYGYSVIRYERGTAPSEFLQYYVTNIGSALEKIRADTQTRQLIARLSAVYILDATTGLSNRHGFDAESKKMYNSVLREGGSMAIIGIDMDGLKIINDTFGHIEGDSSLKALADAIQEACFTDEMCFRVGGDEFQVIAREYSENSVKKFCKRFVEALDKYNQNSGKPYNIQASYGYAICTGYGNRTLSEWMTISDNNMYDMKKSKKLDRNVIR